jgi:uncharacterized protein YjdB/sugar lactone lactonase YvrE
MKKTKWISLILSISLTLQLFIGIGSGSESKAEASGGAASNILVQSPRLVVNNLNNPQGIVVDSKGNIYVSGSNSTIIKMNPSGDVLGWIGSGNCVGFNGTLGIFCFPKGMTIDKNDRIFIADTYNNRIQIMDVNGNIIGKLGNVTYPQDIAIDSNGNHYIPDSSYYLVQRGDAVTSKNFINILNSNGDNLANFGANGSNASQFNLPESIAIDAKGNLFIADAKNHRIQKFDSNRNFLLSWGGFGTNSGQFNSPSGIAIDKDGHVYVADRLNNRIQKFDNSGAYLGQIGNSGCSDATGNICRPNDLTIGPDGSLYVAEGSNTFDDGGQANFKNRIQIFNVAPNVAGGASSSNLIYNGDFEQGNVGFNSALRFQFINGTNGYYDIKKNIQLCFNSTTLSERTTGGGNLFYVDASNNSTNFIWKQELSKPLVQGNQYKFKAYVASSCNSNRPLINFQISKDGVNWTNLNSPVRLTNDLIWNLVEAEWTAPSAGNYQIRLMNYDTNLFGNDFAVDDLFFGSSNLLVAANSVTVNPTSMTLALGQIGQFTATVNPNDATNQNVTWKSSNIEVATVDSTGRVTALSSGNAIITVTTADGGTSDSAVVIVNSQIVLAKSIAFEQTAVNLEKDKTIVLTPKFSPSNTTDKTIQWTSSDTTIATVNSSGEIKGIQEGSTIITALNPASLKLAQVMVTVVGATMKVQDIFDKISPAVAFLETYDAQDQLVSTASGFLVNSTGRLVTNLHAVINPDRPIHKIKAIFPDQSFSGITRVMGYDITNDIAVLQIDGVSNLPFVNLANLSDLRTGDSVLAIGSPSKLENTLTQGIISSKSRKLGNTTYIQTNADIAEGSSGGVLLNMRGEAVGITTARFGEVGANLNFAIPIDAFKNISLNKPQTLADIKNIYITTTNGIKRFSIINNPVSRVTLNLTKATIAAGATQQLTATVFPANASLKTVLWTSSNTAVATVTATGVVRGVGNGTAIITATTQEGKKTATSTVTITTTVSSVTLDQTALTLNPKKTAQLKATVSPANASNKKLQWTTSDSKVATVSPTGLVTAVGSGTATITVTSEDDRTKKATVSVTVTAVKIPVASVTINPKTIKLVLNKTSQLKATINPNNVSNKNVTWSSSDPLIATVDADGRVTAKAMGKSTITATSAEDPTKKATVNITVTAVKIPVSSVTVDSQTATLAPNKTLQLKATVNPNNATNKKISWVSSNKAIATVDANGKITAKTRGTVNITATSADDPTKKVTVKVTVQSK